MGAALLASRLLLARLEAIEAAIGGSSELAFVGRESGSPVGLGSGLGGGGLPVGSPAPEFTIPSLDGELSPLRSLLADRRPLLLVLSDAGCGPCEPLLPDVAGWEREHADRLAVAVIASGEPRAKRDKVERHDLERVSLQSEREVSDAYEAHATPLAVVIGADGLIASPTVGGVEAIRTLVAQRPHRRSRSCMCPRPMGTATACRRRIARGSVSQRPGWCWPTLTAIKSC